MEGQVVADVDDVAAVGLDVPVMDSWCGGLRIPVAVGPVAIIPVDVRPVVVLPEFMIPDGLCSRPPLARAKMSRKTMTMITKARLLFRGLPLE